MCAGYCHYQYDVSKFDKFLFSKGEPVIYSKRVVECIFSNDPSDISKLPALSDPGHSQQDVELFLSFLKLAGPLSLYR